MTRDRFIGQCTMMFPPMLVIEFCARGNLRDYLRKVVPFPTTVDHFDGYLDSIGTLNITNASNNLSSDAN